MASERSTDNKSKSTTRRSQQTVAPAPAAPQGAIAGPEMLEMQGAIEDIGTASPTAVLRLQRAAGNRAVQRLIDQHKVQTKLTVGPAHDKYEDEADRTAALVMRMPAPESTTPPPKLNDDEIRTKRSESEAGFEAGSDIEQRLAANKGNGSPLPNGTRSFMETRFGADFSGVRIHTGGESNQLNRSMQAQAFTHGSDIYFGDGKYNPGSTGGKQLLAHELTHVVQQTGTVARRLADGELLFNNQLPKDVTKVSRQVVQRDDTEDEGVENEDEGAEADTKITPEQLSTKLGSRYPVSPDSDKALTVAEKTGGDYIYVRPLVKAYMPEGHQKQVNDVQGFFQRVKGKNLDLRDFLRAYLLGQYANVLNQLYNDPEKIKAYPTQKAKEKRRDKTYLPKALETRDKYKPLLKKGISSPETRAFLESQGFDEALPLNDEEKSAQIASGPRIEVRSTYIGMKILGMGLRAHLYIVYTNSEGRQFYYRGGPGQDGNTVADMGDYVPGTVDWDPSAPSKTILEGEAAKSKADALAEATTVIDGLKVPYVGFTGAKKRDGENCNATAWTILDRAGLPKQKPSGFHPGWGHILGAALGQGTGAMAEKETTEQENVPGFPLVLSGGEDANIQVYADRAGAEKLIVLPGGTKVDMIRDTRFKNDTDLYKIRFGENKTGYIKTDDAEGRDGKPYVVTGDASNVVPVYEFNTLKTNGDFLAGGDPITVVDELPSEPKPVRIWYTAGTDMRGGRISSAQVAERAKPKYTHIPLGRPTLLMPAGVRMMVFRDFEATDAYEYVFDADRTLRIVVAEDLKKKGVCKVDVMGTGKYFFAKLDDLFDASGLPTTKNVIGDKADEEPEDVNPKAGWLKPPEGGTLELMDMMGSDTRDLNKAVRIIIEDEKWPNVDDYMKVMIVVEGMGYWTLYADSLKKHFVSDAHEVGAEEGSEVEDEDNVVGGEEPDKDVDEEHVEEEPEVEAEEEVVPTKSKGATEGEKLAAYEKAKQVFEDMEGLDLQVIMSGALTQHELDLAMKHKDGVAEELAELSRGHLNADEIQRWVHAD